MITYLIYFLQIKKSIGYNLLFIVFTHIVHILVIMFYQILKVHFAFSIQIYLLYNLTTEILI